MVTENDLNFGTGTAAQVLTSNGAGVSPTFQTPSIGALKLIETKQLSSAASAEFKTGISSTYTTYLFIWNCTTNALADDSLTLSSNGGSSYSITNYVAGETYFTYNSNALSNAFRVSSIPLLIQGSGSLWCFNIAVALNPFFVGDYVSVDLGGTNPTRFLGTATNTAITSVNAFKFTPNAGSFTGTISLYGLLE